MTEYFTLNNIVKNSKHKPLYDWILYIKQYCERIQNTNCFM